jgi:5,6-dimethylbenzimidazole synthase
MQMVNMGNPTTIKPPQLLEILRHRRSSRSGYIENKPLSDEQIETILEAARAAPSAGNAQPWEFIVIRDRETRHRIADLFKHQLRDKLELERTIRKSSKVGASLGWRFAPVLILVLGDPRTSDAFPLRTREDKAESHFISSLANATLQMMLMAECMGLGCQYISDVASPYFSLMLKHQLDIPPELRVYHLIPFGYVSVAAGPNSRRPIEAMVHYDRYDRSKQRTAEDILRFMQEESIQSKNYQWGGSKAATSHDAESAADDDI